MSMRDVINRFSINCRRRPAWLLAESSKLSALSLDGASSGLAMVSSEPMMLVSGVRSS